MTSLDTNIVVRVVTGDDPEQLEQALTAMRSQALWLSKSVLLETEWVLRYSYKISPAVIQETLRRLLGLSNLTVEDRQAVLTALDWFAGGMDFADALHLASSRKADEFVTFDQPLAKKGASLETSPPVRLLSS